MKSCLHKSFLSQPRFIDAVISGFKTCVDRLKDSSDATDFFDYLTFCSTRLELKQSAVNDKSMAVDSKEPLSDVKPR